MEFKKIVPGYPCSNYIIDKISTNDDLWIFIKTFTKSAYERGMTCSEIISHLTALLSSFPATTNLSCPDFGEYGDTDEEICHYLRNTPAVPNLKNCSALYKKTDPHTGACKICKYSRLYCNQKEDIEYSVLKYMLENESNLNFVSDCINDAFFTSCMDISMGIPLPKAYVLPMTKILAQSLFKTNIRLMLFSTVMNTFFMADTPFDIVWEDAYRTFPRKRKIPAVLSNNPMWQNVLKTKLKENIINSATLTRKELQDIFSKYLADSQKNPDSVSNNTSKSRTANNSKFPEGFEQIYLEDIIVSLDSTQPAEQTMPAATIGSLENNTKEITGSDRNTYNAHNLNTCTEKKEYSETVPASDDETSTNMSFAYTEPLNVSISDKQTNPTVTDTKSQEYIPPSFTSTAELSTHKNISLPDTLSVISDNSIHSDVSFNKTDTMQSANITDNNTVIRHSPVTANEPGIGTDSSLNSDLILRPSSINLTGDSTMENSNKTMLNIDIKNRNLIQSPFLPDYIRKQLIIHVRKNKPLPSPFYQGVLRDKEIDIEIVRGSNETSLFLMWSRHIKKFITMNVEDCSDELKKILSYKSIKKLCHTPYILYGICKLFSIPVKNVFSIQTVHGRLFPKNTALAYADLFMTYKTKKEYGSFVTPDMVSECCFLGGMPLYKELHKILLQMIMAQGGYSLYMHDAFLDEALGCSYFYKLNFKDKGTLMNLIGNSQFYFNKEFSHKKRTPGKCYRYYIKERKNVVPLFRYILQRLSEKGIFRTTSLQVLGLDQQQLLLFIETEQEEYISSLIDLLIFEYGHTFPNISLDIYNSVYNM